MYLLIGQFYEIVDFSYGLFFSFAFISVLIFKIYFLLLTLEFIIFFSFSSCLGVLLLQSHFSRVRLCVTPETAAHQALPSLGFSRQEHWSGLQLPSPLCESEVAQLHLTRSDPMDCSLPGSSIHGIFQARVLE